MLRIVLEGGRSDTQREELDVDQPPASIEREGESYGPVLDYYDQPMRDITGAWRYRILTPFRAMPRGYEAPRIKP